MSDLPPPLDFPPEIDETGLPVPDPNANLPTADEQALVDALVLSTGLTEAVIKSALGIPEGSPP